MVKLEGNDFHYTPMSSDLIRFPDQDVKWILVNVVTTVFYCEICDDNFLINYLYTHLGLKKHRKFNASTPAVSLFNL